MEEKGVSLDELTFDFDGEHQPSESPFSYSQQDLENQDEFDISEVHGNLELLPQAVQSEVDEIDISFRGLLNPRLPEPIEVNGFTNLQTVGVNGFTEISYTKDMPGEHKLDTNYTYEEDINDIQIGLQTDGGEENDFEEDIPDLSMIPRTRKLSSDEDSDSSEFEVPDQPVKTEETKSTDTGQNNRDQPNSDFNITLDLVQSEGQELALLTPQNQVTSKLSSATDSHFTPERETDETSNRPLVDPVVTKAATESLQLDDSNAPATSFDRNCSQTSSVGQQEEKHPDIKEVTPILDAETVPDTHKPDIVTTAEDWEGVQTVEPVFADSGKTDPAVALKVKPLLTFSQSWAQFESDNYSSVKDQVKCSIDRKGFSAFTHFLFGPPKMHKDLLQERELLFCIAATALDNNKESHLQVLYTIYRCLTGSKFDCQRFGGHWEEIGFQGRDPATDLRGTGMLALLHLLFFLQDPETKELAREVYKLSLHPTQNFPFCVMGINLSRICLQVLREDVYNKECNRRNNVTSTINDVYAALYLHLFQLWKKGKTIADSGFVLQDVETYARKNSKSVFKDLETYEKTRKQQGPFGDTQEDGQAFFSVCKEDKYDKTAAELY